MVNEVRPPVKAKLDSSYFGGKSKTRLSSRFRGAAKSKPSLASPSSPSYTPKGHWTPDSITPAPQRSYCLPCFEGAEDEAGDEHFYVVQGEPGAVTFTAGTNQGDGIWLNKSDKTGLIMSCLVWVLMAYATLVIIFLGKSEGIPQVFSTVFVSLACLALACHAKTSLTDPGTVPINAEPLEVRD